MYLQYGVLYLILSRAKFAVQLQRPLKTILMQISLVIGHSRSDPVLYAV
jgi:hypothetical protein